MVYVVDSSAAYLALGCTILSSFYLFAECILILCECQSGGTGGHMSVKGGDTKGLLERAIFRWASPCLRLRVEWTSSNILDTLHSCLCHQVLLMFLQGDVWCTNRGRIQKLCCSHRGPMHVCGITWDCMYGILS